MTTRDTSELWADISPLPAIDLGRADLYLRFPSKGGVAKARESLQQSRYALRMLSDPLNICVQDVEPLPPLNHLARILTPPEFADTLALLRPAGVPLAATDVLHAISAGQLRDRLASTWLIEMLQAEDLTCVFQPIVDAKDRTSVFGYEALARGHWRGEEIQPLRMIEVAESAHVMSQLNALAMQTALTEAANSHIQHRLFVNCSPSDVFDPVSRIAAMAAYCDTVGLDRTRVVFEITEAEKHDMGHLTNFVRACRRHQFCIAIDDVGAGYSTLAALSAIRPDLIKLDRGLVSSVDKDPYRAIILNRMLEASRILGISTVVEGVETEGEFNWAVANGATYVQGNLIGRPAKLQV